MALSGQLQLLVLGWVTPLCFHTRSGKVDLRGAKGERQAQEPMGQGGPRWTSGWRRDPDCDLSVSFVSVLHRLVEEPGQRGNAGEYGVLRPPHGPIPSSLSSVTLPKPEPPRHVRSKLGFPL